MRKFLPLLVVMFTLFAFTGTALADGSAQMPKDGKKVEQTIKKKDKNKKSKDKKGSAAKKKSKKDKKKVVKKKAGAKKTANAANGK
ncbi:MAG: hypothetical protein ACOZBL_03265 [Patescibacteria group bacterium]